MNIGKIVCVSMLIRCLLTFDNIGRVAGSNLTLHWKFIGNEMLEVKMEWRQPTFAVLLLGNSMTRNDMWLCSWEPNSTGWVVIDRWYVATYEGLRL
jgi:hypothetical protein